MALGKSSFRRILFFRLLLVSVPVLLLGMYITYRKARSAFLETTRQNLTESAITKANYLDRSIVSLRSNLINVSNNTALKSEDRKTIQVFIEDFSRLSSTETNCVQVIDFNNKQLIASTCGKKVIDKIIDFSWQKNISSPQIKLLPNTFSSENKDKLQIICTTPIYHNLIQPRYLLLVQNSLISQTKNNYNSLFGDTVIINQKGMILTHPLAERVGVNIHKLPDGERLGSILRNALEGEKNFLHLFYFDRNKTELIAGYASISSPLTDEPGEKWAILAVSSLDNSLAPLEEIQKALIFMMLGLIATSFVAILYMSRDIALPLEKLRDYALNEKHVSSPAQIPQNFKIREFKELAIALNQMVERLKAWGQEIVNAWEEAQQANQLKNEFLATTSHELRTPLNGIINSIRLVKDGYCDNKEEEIEFLEQADIAAIHLLEIINDILEISKIEAGNLSVNIEPVDLQQILTEVIHLTWPSIQKKGLQLQVAEWQEKIIVNADPGKFKQVLVNVIDNAIKFTAIGSITISLRIENRQSNLDITEISAKELDSDSLNALLADYIAIISIRDTGIGINPLVRDKLFRPFVMVDGSTTRKYGGTGLGLAIAKNLMDLMGGKIDLFSLGEGEGTTVEIGVPLQTIAALEGNKIKITTHLPETKSF